MKNIIPFLLLSFFLNISCKKDATIEEKEPNNQKKVEDPISLCSSQSKKLETDPSILGLDISHFQGDIQWNDLKSDGVNFVYIKASEGTEFKDPKYTQNYASAKKECLYRGAYHFYETGKNPKKQAQNFIEAVNKLESGDLPPVIDLEELGIKTPVTKEVYETNVLLWLKIVEEKLGIRPILYSNTVFANRYLKHPEFSKYKFWIADYTKAKSPEVPYTWRNKGWIIWQRTDQKKLKGALGDVDYDIFNGNAEAFIKLIKK